MLGRANDLSGYKLSARDGDIGKVTEFYFDDQSWTVRYLVTDTGGWLSGRTVLISRYALDPANETRKVIPVDLTKGQIEKSPSLASNKPVSRQYEWDYFPITVGRDIGVARTHGGSAPIRDGGMVCGPRPLVIRKMRILTSAVRTA